MKRCALAVAAAAFFSAHAQELSDNIVVDQFGYRETAEKIAVVRSPQIGAGSPSSYTPSSQFEVIDEAGGGAVFSGAPVPFNGGQTDNASGDKIWHFNFSGVTAPGRYYVVDKTNNLRSFSFNIADDVYNNVLKAAVRTLYYQRAGTAKPAQYAGADWADNLCFDQDKRTRSFFAKNDASTERDLSGGWFDAGDYNKYTKWTSDYVAAMLLMYEENPDAFGDNYGIPESGDGVPDILNEAKWGLDWLLKMQNEDGSVLSVQGLSGGSPPSSVTAPSYYGPANATAAFGSAAAFAIAARLFAERGETVYAERLKTAALGAWEWGSAHPDSMFHNNSTKSNSVGLAAGNQEIEDDGTKARSENRATAAYYLYELTGDNSLLTTAENLMNEFPLFAWTNFMDHYRHSSHLLYMRYLQNPNINNPAFKDKIRSAMRIAFAKPANFYGAHATDGYRAFIADYNWGSNKAKADYGETFYKWSIVEPSADHRDIAESYLHYIHGVNPFNMVYLSNMNGYGASRSLTMIYHTWFAENSGKWSVAGNGGPGPAPGFLAGGPNSNFKWDGCCPSGCGSSGNNEKCFLVELPTNQPPAKMYRDMNHNWPLNSWEITEPSNGYQLSYIRLLSKFVSKGVTASAAPRKLTNKAAAPSYKKRRGGIELRVTEKAEIRIFALNGAMVSRQNFMAGVHVVNLSKLSKGTYIMKMSVDGQKKVLRIPSTF